MAGFFATEVFVASVHPPAGAVAPPSKGLFRRGTPATDHAGPGSDDVADAGGSGGGHVGPVAKTPAPGASGNSGPARTGSSPPTEPPAVETDRPADELPPAVTYERPLPKAGDSMADSLAALADGTTDQLSLNFDSIPTHSFDEVLAEAEAAVAGVTAWSDRPGPSVQMVVAPPAEGPGIGDPPSDHPAPRDEKDRATPPEDTPAEPTAAQESAPKGGDLSATSSDGPDAVPRGATPPLEGRRRSRPKNPAPRAPRSRTTPPGASRRDDAVPAPQPIPDLFAKLQSLGVPDAHLPATDRPTLDTVAQTLDGLPVAPPLPTAPGTVIALVGTPAALARTARLLVGDAPFRHGVPPDPSKLVWTPEDRTEPDRPLDGVLQEGDPLEVAGRVARRRLDGRPSLVTVEVVPGHPLRSHDRTVIASVQPDYVLGAVEASVKRADIVQWRDELGAVDALALWGLDGTVSPAELLGVLPIAFVDGVPGTPLSWTLTLLHRAAEGGG